jgi:DNA-binding NarL/FixJ family response regulator
MRKEAVAAVLADAFQHSDPAYAMEINQIEEIRSTLVRHYTELVSKLDVSEKTNWKTIVAAALDAGVSEGEIQQELGASPSTIYRWLQDDIAPREGTRRLMKGALVDLMGRRQQALRAAAG